MPPGISESSRGRAGARMGLLPDQVGAAASPPAATPFSLFGLESHTPLGPGWRGYRRKSLHRPPRPSMACQPLTVVSTPALTLGRGCRNGAPFR